MVKTEQFTVGNNSYSVTQWNATKALVMKLRLGRYLGGLLDNVTQHPENIANTLLANVKNILATVDIEDFVNFLKEVICSASRNGEKMILARFDTYFTDNLMEVYEVAFKILEVNYKDFLGSVLNLRRGLSSL